MKANLEKVVVGCSLLLLGLAGAAEASPLFSIGEGSSTSWQDAINAGNVVPVLAVDGMTKAETEFYQNEATSHGIDGFGLRDAYLTPDLNVSDGFETHQAMVMAWEQQGHAGNNVGDVAAWEYVYDVDPDLTGLHLSFSLLASGVWDVSVELIDVNGRQKAWFLPGPSPNWQNALIDLSSNAANQGGFMLHPVDPLFDITQVVAIRFDESGIWSMPFPVPPSGTILPPSPPPPAPPAPGWNAWNHVAVIPEPGTMLLAVLGAIGGVLISARRLRRR